MAAVTVDTAIKPEAATCCRGELEQLTGDRWECTWCGCQLRAELSGFVPRGWRIVVEVITDTCRLYHD